MSNSTMNPAVAEAGRAELVAIGTSNSRLQRNQRNRRVVVISVAVLAVAAATMGAAAIVGSFPGATTVTPLSSVVSARQTGTGDIELGLPPAGASAVIVNLTCVSGTGTIGLTVNANGGATKPYLETIDCSQLRVLDVPYAQLPQPGTTSIVVTAPAGTTWKATAQYASTSTTAWGVNANGQTYGVANADGFPDLEAARATNGAEGYVLKSDIGATSGSTFIKVYESDGETVIGEFPVNQP